MRLELTLNRTTKQRMLPMHYQYYVSAWIYKVIRHADADFSEFLHDKGYGNTTKAYKLFCFKRLHFGKPKLWKDKGLFEINQQKVTLQVSFDVKEAAVNFIKGLFVEQEFYLGDRFNGIDFKVEQVVVLDEPEFVPTMRYRLMSPWVVSYCGESDEHAQYLSPDDARFTPLALKHIKEKAETVHQIVADDMVLTVMTESKRSGFLIKPGTQQETRVVGHLFDFELEAPVEVHRMLWNAGVSEKGPSGFGWLEMITN